MLFRSWATTQALRTGMERLRDSVTPALVAQEEGRLTAGEAGKLPAAVQAHVTYVMRNCQLAPKADATLHVFLTRSLEGAAELAADPHSYPGAEKLAAVLRDYPRYFDHPGWNAVPPARP